MNKKKPVSLTDLGSIKKKKRDQNTLGQGEASAQTEEDAISVAPRKSRAGRKRTSNRNIQLSFKVTQEFYDTLTKISEEENLYLVEVLEKALRQYDTRK